MSWFYKKETLIRTICFMSFFVAINVVCSFLTTVLPLISIGLIIFLPLTSAMVEVMCKDRWFPIYAFATIGLSIVISLSSIDFTIFYIVPSIFTGYIFGLFSKKNLPSMFAIFIATIIQTFLSLVYIPLFNLISGTNFIDVFMKILRISDRFLFEDILLIGFFVVSLMQIILSYIVVSNELNKFGQKREIKNSENIIATCSILLSIIVSILFAFAFKARAICYLFVGITYYFAVFVIIFQIKQKNILALSIAGTSLLIGLILYAALNKYFTSGNDIVLLEVAPFIIALESILHYFLKKSEQ